MDCAVSPPGPGGFYCFSACMRGLSEQRKSDREGKRQKRTERCVRLD